MKQIAFLKKKPGVSRAEFVQLYEQEHAPLIARLLPFFTDYRRNYVFAESNSRFAHDVIMEMWFESAAQQENMGRRIADREVGETMRADEERLFDRAAMVMFTVDEHGGARPSLPEPQVAARTFILAQAEPDTERSTLITDCETRFVPELLSLLAAHKLGAPQSLTRNYPVPGGTFKMPHLATAAYPVDFDAIIEIGFAGPADQANFSTLIDSGSIAQLLSASPSEFIDPTATICLVTEERRSPPF